MPTQIATSSHEARESRRIAGATAAFRLARRILHRYGYAYEGRPDIPRDRLRVAERRMGRALIADALAEHATGREEE